MVRVPAQQIVDALVQAVRESGGDAWLPSKKVQGNPRRFRVRFPDGELRPVWIYIWSLTHGGRVTLPDEYRIQMTGVTSPLSLCKEAGGLTLLLGYESGTQAFAGFDLTAHQTFTEGSPSVQIQIGTVRESLAAGMAFERKSNDEVAIGVRPDLLLTYASYASSLHAMASEHAAIDAVRALSGSDVQADFNREAQSLRHKGIGPERQVVIQEIARLSRDSRFRSKIMRAYDARCALTGVQLDLPEAAHILPVASPDSTDSVSNGIALLPSFHRAFDRGLIYLTESLEMRAHAPSLSRLASVGRDGGMPDFTRHLGPIRLPDDPEEHPSRLMIRKANALRGVN